MKLIAVSAALIGSALLLAQCDNDDDGGGGGGSPGIQTPVAQNVVPSSFRNTKDEAGFKQKLPETASVMQDSAAGLSLNGQSKQAAVRERQFDLRKLVVAGMTKRLGMSDRARSLLIKGEAARFIQGQYIPGGSSQETPSEDFSLTVLEQDGERMLEETQILEVGDDCTPLLGLVSGQYEQALSAYSRAVNEIAAVDFSQAQGFTKDTLNSTQEAFAYRIALNSSDMQQNGQAIEGDYSVTGRFSGGANDSAVVLRANGKMNMNGDSSSGDVGLDLNTYADVNAKVLSLGTGVVFSLTGQENGQVARMFGNINLKTELKGGMTPSQSVSLEGRLNDGQESAEFGLNATLSRLSAASMHLSLNANANGETLARTVEMAIEQDGFGYETCKVASVSN